MESSLEWPLLLQPKQGGWDSPMYYGGLSSPTWPGRLVKTPKAVWSKSVWGKKRVDRDKSLQSQTSDLVPWGNLGCRTAWVKTINKKLYQPYSCFSCCTWAESLIHGPAHHCIQPSACLTSKPNQSTWETASNSSVLPIVAPEQRAQPVASLSTE